MVTPRPIAFMTAGVVLMALVGCAVIHGKMHGNLTSSADRLEHKAQALARETSAQPPATDYSASIYSRDASDLADRAHELRRALEDKHADDEDVNAAFEQLSHSYHTLRDHAKRDEYRFSRVDLGPVTEAYLDVERRMSGYRENHSYASQSDQHDRL